MRYLLALLLLFGCGSGGGNDSGVSIPNSPRTEKLLYGYYGTMQGASTQLAETSDHITLCTAWRWWGPAQQLQEALACTLAGLPVIWDMRDDTEADVRARFQEMKQAGVIQNIAVIYRYDELDLNGPNPSVVRENNAILRAVAAEFNIKPKLATIYSVRAVSSFPAIDAWDWVGVGAFDAGASMLTNGIYTSLKANLQPAQRIILIPYGSNKWRQDPAPFLAKAESDGQVALILPFTWRDFTDPANGANEGIRSNGMDTAYKATGLKIKQGQP